MKANCFGRLPILVTLIISFFQARSQVTTTSTSAQTVVTTFLSGGTDWTNPGNVQTADAVFATSLITGSNKPTYYLDAKNWGFQSGDNSLSTYIPPSATVNGIEVYVTLRKTGTGSIKDNKIVLLKAGVESPTNKARTTLWPSVAGEIKFGSTVDLWGTTWTPADLINTGFGVRISAKNPGKKDAQAEIDNIRIVVYFNQPYFYSKSTGNLEALATWGRNTDGSGAAPLDFTTSGQAFFLVNRASASLTGNLTISGTYSKMVIGNGTSATSLTIPSNYALNSTVDIATLSNLTITNTTSPTIGAIADNSTVTYNAAGNQNVQEAAYYNLSLSGSGVKTLQGGTNGSTIVNNALTIGSGVQFSNSGYNVYINGTGTGITNNGVATGAGRYVYSLLDVSTSITGTGSYSNLEVNFSSSSASAKTLTLSGATTITGFLYLTDGTFSNGSNLSMASGSTIQLADGTLGNSIASSSGYDVVYDVPASGTSKTTANEISGSVRNLTVQTGSGYTINLSKNLLLSGNLTITSGTLDPTTSNWAVSIGGNYSNSGSFTTRSSVVTFNGSSAQTISAASSQSFYDLVINNTSGGVQLNTPVSLTHGLTLTTGLLTTSSTNSLTLPNGVTLTGGSATSFVNGPLIHTLSALSGTRVFPIGKNGAYRPVTLTLTQNAATATTYTGEVFAGPAPTRTLPSGIVSLSATRYYTISCSNNGNVSSATVTLNYGPDENTVDNSILRIVKSNGPSAWINIGGMGSAPNTGTITSGNFNSFSDFVIGFSSFPLPLHWLSFKGSEKNGAVTLNWQTSDESDCSHFSIERSLNRVDWEEIGKVNCKNGLLNSYSFTDNIYSQQVFYRIKLVNRDGSFSYSTIVTIRSTSEGGFRILQNPVAKNEQLTCLVDDAAMIASVEWRVNIVDYRGRTMLSEKKNPGSKLSISTSRLSRGTYLLIIQAGPRLIRKEFIVE